MHAALFRPRAILLFLSCFSLVEVDFPFFSFLFFATDKKNLRQLAFFERAVWPFSEPSLVSTSMSARQSEDGLGLGGMLPDPAVLERMLSAAGLRVHGEASGMAASIAGAPNQPQNQNQHATTTSFAAALDSIVREEQEAAAASAAAAAAAAPQPLALPLPLPPQAAAPFRKVCRLCRLEQPLDSFYRVSTSRDGRDARCRTCDARKCAERRKRRRERRDEDSEGGGGSGDGRELPPLPPTEKLCRSCAVSKPAASFYVNRANCDGLCDTCRPCFNAAAAERKAVKVRLRRQAAAAAAGGATTEKQCRRCALLLPSRDFHRNAAAVDGLAAACKRCHGEVARERAERRSGSSGGDDSGPLSRECGRCCSTKPRSEFHGSSASADGLQSYCKACTADKAAERRMREAAKGGRRQ